jgi:translation initiation factor IF-3
VIDDENGEQLGIMNTDDARAIAIERGLDLVEVAPLAKPPVCKIMDYGKFKYDQKKKAQKAKAKQHQVQIKEIRLRPKTDKHDLDVKIKKAVQFLEAGNKVLFKMRFRGREHAHKDRGAVLLEGVVERLEELAKVEKAIGREGQFMTLLLAPHKKES